VTPFYSAGRSVTTLPFVNPERANRRPEEIHVLGHLGNRSWQLLNGVDFSPDFIARSRYGLVVSPQ
jgi:hypothetical protein